MKPLLIFDLDGTLINSLEDLAEAVNDSLAQQGFQTHSVEKYKTFLGNGILKLIERALPQNACAPDIIQKTKELFDTYYNAHQTTHTKPYKDMVPTLEKLKLQGVKMGVVTNKPHQHAIKIINELFGENFFDYVTGERAHIPIKPDPKGVLSVIKALGYEGKEKDCFYIGDSNVDIFTAKNAKVTAVGVLWGFRSKTELEEAGAQILLENPTHLVDLLS